MFSKSIKCIIEINLIILMCRWWNNFSRNIGLSYIRCRVVESYTWAYVVYYQRGFKLPRRIIAMMIVLITTVDDTYDIHATIDDCRKLHEAIQRWSGGHYISY